MLSRIDELLVGRGDETDFANNPIIQWMSQEIMQSMKRGVDEAVRVGATGQVVQSTASAQLAALAESAYLAHSSQSSAQSAQSA